MSRAARLSSGGFTLLEILIVFVVLGILAGIAVPNFRRVVYKADAAKVLTDVGNVRLAVYEFLEDKHGLPPMGSWGAAPGDLLPYLNSPGFRYKDLEYMLWSNETTGRVQLRVRYPEGSQIGAALARHRVEGFGDEGVQWTSVLTTFHLLTSNGAPVSSSLLAPQSSPPLGPPDPPDLRPVTPGYVYVCHGQGWRSVGRAEGSRWQELPEASAAAHKAHGDRTTIGHRKRAGALC